MKPKPQTYLAIEGSIAASLATAVLPHLEDVARQAAEHAAKDQPENALGVLDGWTPPQLGENHRAKLGELAVSALLFGASRMGPPQQSRYMTDLPALHLKLAAHQAEVIATRAMRKQVVAQVSNFVRAYRKDAPLPEAVPGLFKHECAPGCTHGSRFLKADDPYDDLAAAMNGVVMGTGRAMTDLAANLTTSRLAAFGALGEAQTRKMDFYQIDSVLDDRTCPICEHMNGRRFPVTHSIGRVEALLLLDDPEDLKKAAPFPRQSKAAVADFRSLSSKELQQKGWSVPPWHPGCRCMIVADGDATGHVQPLHADKPEHDDKLTTLWVQDYVPSGDSPALTPDEEQPEDFDTFWAKLVASLKKPPRNRL